MIDRLRITAALRIAAAIVASITGQAGAVQAGVLATEVVVVCPPSLQRAMDGWRAFRESQGAGIVFVAPAESVAESTARVRGAFASERPAAVGRCVVLVGDGASAGPAADRQSARVVQRWGPESDIATDAPYADTDGDGTPDAAVGRLPFETPESLQGYLRRVIECEERPPTWGDLNLRFATSPGGFGPLVDSVIEATARTVIGGLVPEACAVSLTRLGVGPITAPIPAMNKERSGPSGRGGVWVYLGHGLRDRLAGLPATPTTASGLGADAAVLIACYAGAFEDRGDCFAERLLRAPDGPGVVIAATRVSMPYGNAVLGAGLLRELSATRADTYGDALHAAKQTADGDDPLLATLRSIAATLGAGAESLEEEVVDHARMYTLLGDPLFRVRRPEAIAIETPEFDRGDQAVVVRGVAPHAGRLRAGLHDRLGTGSTATEEITVREGEPFVVRLRVPGDGRGGQRVVSARLLGAERHSAARGTVRVERPTPSKIAQRQGEPSRR